MKTIRIGAGAGYLRRPHRARGGARRGRRTRLPRLRVPGRAHHRARPAGEAERSRRGLRSAARRPLRRRPARLPRQQGEGRHQHGRGQPGRRRRERARSRAAGAARAEGRGGHAATTCWTRARRGDFRCVETGGPRRRRRRPDGLGQRLSRRRADRGGAHCRRRHRHHRAGERPGAVPAPLCTRSAGRPTTGTASAGTVVGHLLECAGQVTGGYFADPGHRTFPIWRGSGFRSPR